MKDYFLTVHKRIKRNIISFFEGYITRINIETFSRKYSIMNF